MPHTPTQIKTDGKVDKTLKLACLCGWDALVPNNLIQHFTQLVNAARFVFDGQGAHAHATEVERYSEQVKRRREVEGFVTFFGVIPSKQIKKRTEGQCQHPTAFRPLNIVGKSSK